MVEEIEVGRFTQWTWIRYVQVDNEIGSTLVRPGFVSPRTSKDNRVIHTEIDITLGGGGG